MTITSTAPVLSVNGISAPTYAEILDYLQSQYRTIYGVDIYLGSDSQDGQFIAIIAAAINDANSAAIAVYNAFSPTTAQGTSLSSVVKINGVTRAVPTNSTASLSIVGVAGTAIVNGVVQDVNRVNWALPATVNIPIGGAIAVTATCAVAGAVTALASSINLIITPQLGWQSANNPLAAVLGAPVEKDSPLRQRQAVSVSQPAQTPLVSVVGAIAALPGVTRYTAYENPTTTTDANGLPPHSISAIVEGGVIMDIATVIANRKTIGAPTYGTQSQTVTTSFGIAEVINFFVLAEDRVVVAINLHPINGYTSAIGDEIKATIAAYINALAIGSSVFLTRLYNPANLNGSSNGLTYEIITLAIGVFPATPGAADIVVAFNHAAHCDVSDITITLV